MPKLIRLDDSAYKLIITINEEFKTDGGKRHVNYFVRIKRSIDGKLWIYFGFEASRKMHILPIFEEKKKL